MTTWRHGADAGVLAKPSVEGIRAMKIWPFDSAAELRTVPTAVDLDEQAGAVRKIRDAVGNEMEIMVELHGLWSLAPMLRIARALEPYDVFWLEEPIRFNEFDAMADLARHTSIPIAASERMASRRMFKQLIDKRAASIIMIDLAWYGGISEARKIANMAEASELPVTLHDCTRASGLCRKLRAFRYSAQRELSGGRAGLLQRLVSRYRHGRAAAGRRPSRAAGRAGAGAQPEAGGDGAAGCRGSGAPARCRKPHNDGLGKSLRDQ